MNIVMLTSLADQGQPFEKIGSLASYKKASPSLERETGLTVSV
jgi:hypothetical protein